MCKYSILDESTYQDYQELDCYREIGTVRSFRRLKYQEQRRNRRRQILHNILWSILWLVVIIEFSWVIASWIDVLCHNHHPDPVYQPWNFFIIITDIFGN